jgi:hypothetical protein
MTLPDQLVRQVGDDTFRPAVEPRGTLSMSGEIWAILTGVYLRNFGRCNNGEACGRFRPAASLLGK